MSTWKSVNLAGKNFGNWQVLSRAANGTNWRVFWNCRCVCGIEKTVRSDLLKSGQSTSCGCVKEANFKARLIGNKNNLKHGLYHHPLYKVWGSMKTRCYNKNAPNYPDYGGRGIKMCERWLTSFKNFLDDVGERPIDRGKLSLDRKDVNGDYCKENCKWSTYSEQRKNTRKMRVLQSDNDRLRQLLAQHGLSA